MPHRDSTQFVTKAHLADVQVLAAQRFARTLTWCLCAYPLLWITGLGGLFMVLLAVPSALFLVAARVSKTGLLALLVGVSVAISIPVGFSVFGFDTLRFIGAAANIAVWVVIAASLTAASYVDFRRELLAALCVPLGAQGILVILSALIYPAKLPVPLLDSVANQLPSGIAAFADNALYVPSWLGGLAFRTSGIMANPTWAAATAVLVLLLIASARQFRPGRILTIAGVVGGTVSIYYGLSRTSYALLAVGFGVIVLMWLRGRSRLLFFGAVSVALPLLIVVLIGGYETLIAIFNEVDDARSGSSKSRGEIYAQTWTYVTQNPFALLGYGIKPQEQGLVASVGTLSTYLGLLFRAGVIGLALYIALLWTLARNSLRHDSAAGAAVLVFIAIWGWIADMDAGHFVPLFLTFCVWPRPAVALSQHEGRSTTVRRVNLAP